MTEDQLSPTQVDTAVRLCQLRFGMTRVVVPTDTEIDDLLNALRRLQVIARFREAPADGSGVYMHLMPREE